MENNINVEKNDKKKKFSLDWIKSGIASAFFKDKNGGNELSEDEKILQDFEKTMDENLWMNEKVAKIEDIPLQQKEKIDFSEFIEVKNLKNWLIAVKKKNALVRLDTSKFRYWDLWWVIDSKTWEFLIKPRFFDLKIFKNGEFAWKELLSEGFESVIVGRVPDRYGRTLYDSDGDEISGTYKNCGWMWNDETFLVGKDNTYYLVDKKWHFIFPEEIYWPYGKTIQEETSYRWTEIIHPKKEWYIPHGLCKNNDWNYYLKIEHTWKPNPLFPDYLMWILWFQNWFMKYWYWPYDFRKYWLLDENFNVIIPPKYSEISDFKDWIAIAKIYGEFYDDLWAVEDIWYKYHFLKNDGKPLVMRKVDIDRTWNPQEKTVFYDWVHEFSENMAAVKNKEFRGFLDKNWKMITDFEFSNVWDFKDWKAEVEKFVNWKKIKFWINKDWEYLLWRGDEHEDLWKYESVFWKETILSLRLSKKYDNVIKLPNWLISVRQRGSWRLWLMDENWNEILFPRWNTHFWCSKIIYIGDGMLAVKKRGMTESWSLLNKKWEIVKDETFDEIRWFNSWYAAYKKYWEFPEWSYPAWWNYWNFVDKDGNSLNQELYEKVWDFEGWKAKVKTFDWEKYYIDVNWNRID